MIDIAKGIENLSVLAIGHVTHDRYGDDLVAGGCAYFGAMVAQSLGANVKLLTTVGEDFCLFSALAGLTLSLKQKGKTTVFTNLYPANAPRLQIVETQAPMIEIQDLPEDWKLSRPDILFLAPVMGELNPLTPWAKEINAKLTTMTLQGYMKCGAQSDIEELRSQGKRILIRNPEPLVDQLFEGVDAIFFSDEDLLLYGDDQLKAELIAKVPMVFITQGAKGCLVYLNGKEYQTGIYATSNVVDPTGAGDTFAMATTLALGVGLDPLDAAYFGACASSVMIEGLGSLPVSRLRESYQRFKEKGKLR